MLTYASELLWSPPAYLAEDSRSTNICSVHIHPPLQSLSYMDTLFVLIFFSDLCLSLNPLLLHLVFDLPLSPKNWVLKD